MTAPILEIDRLSIAYHTDAGPIPAVQDVSLTLPAGGTVGLVGESGSGKSTLALGLTRLLPANGRIERGSVRLEGADLLQMGAEQFRRQIRWKQLAMVFQSAMNSLNPVVRVGVQVAQACRLHHPALSRREVESRVKELFEAVELTEEHLRRYPHELSGGMRQRVIIALSLVANPRVLIADEATTALDVLVQDQILSTLLDLRERQGLSLLVISHDIDVIAKMCDHVMVMYAGRIVEHGPTNTVLTRPTHPYTAALLGALPSLTGPRKRLVSLPGTIDRPELLLTGCRFAPRCPMATDICRAEEPILGEGDHASRCHFAGDVRIQEIFKGDG